MRHLDLRISGIEIWGQALCTFQSNFVPWNERKANEMSHRRIVIFLGVLLSGVHGRAQVACDCDGFSGNHACSGVDLMSVKSLAELGGGANGNDCWGWVDPNSGREFVLYGRANGTAIVDITNPLNVRYIANLPTNTVSSLWRDIKVYGHHAYIVSEASGHGMQVLDLSILPGLPLGSTTLLAANHVYNAFGKAHNVIINEDSGYGYAVGSNTFNGGLHVFALDNPAQPVIAGSYDAYYTHDAHPVIYHGPDLDHVGREIVACFNGYNGLHIVDATVKSDIVPVSSLVYNQLGYTHQGWFSEDHRFLYVNDELDEMNFGVPTRTYIVNVEDLDAPFIAGVFQAPVAAIDHNNYVRGSRLYQANYLSGLRILDLSNAEDGSLELIGYFDTNPESDAAQFQGAWSVYPYFPSGNVAVSTMTHLYIVRPSDEIWNEPVAIIPGCTYSFAGNYNPNANSDDGSCVATGCTDPAALNFNEQAVMEDGGCIYYAGNADCPADITGDGVVSVADMLNVLAAFGEACEPQ